MTSTTAISTNEEQVLRQAIAKMKNEMPAIQARADHLEDLLGMIEAEANSASPDADLIGEHVQTVEEQATDLNERVVELNDQLDDILGDEATTANAASGPTLPSSGTSLGEYVSANDDAGKDIREVRVVDESNASANDLAELEAVRFVDPEAPTVNARSTERVEVVEHDLADPVRVVDDEYRTGTQANADEVARATDVIAVNRD